MASHATAIWKPFCPVPHTFRDQLWLSVGSALGAWFGFQLTKWFYRQKLVKLDNPQVGQPPVLGILTGISYVSGIDYYKSVNEGYAKLTGKRHLMPPNPLIVMASVDCDIYAQMLTDRDWKGVEDHLIAGVDRLVRADVDLLCIASNTGHLAFPAIAAKYPDLKILHIADCTAKAIKAKGMKKVGLVGTEPTMQESYLKDRLALHGIDVIVPGDAALPKIFQFIMDELGFNIFKNSTREYFVGEIDALAHRGAEGVILGCTEIELLVQQEHTPNVPLFASAEIHLEALSLVTAGRESLNRYLP